MNNTELHKSTFNALADEYSQRMEEYSVSDWFVVGSTSTYLRQVFSGQTVKVLEIGPGSGLNCKMLIDEGLDLTAIDISKKMCANVKNIAPECHLINDDFLSFDFSKQKYHGIFSRAVLHLFSLDDARIFLRKCRGLLSARGLLFVAVSRGDTDQEVILEKNDYAGNYKRMKRFWTPETLNEELSVAGFEVQHMATKDLDPRGKIWLNVWATVKG